MVQLIVRLTKSVIEKLAARLYQYTSASAEDSCKLGVVAGLVTGDLALSCGTRGMAGER